jgi:cytochrome c-type biogenesis protein
MDLIASLGTSGVPLLAATALGILMAISPCTLATSVAAVTFIAGGTGGRWRVVLVGGLYTLGRIVTYAGLAFLIVSFGLDSKELAVFFRQYGERLLAPVLIAAGLWLLGLFPRVKGPRFLSRVTDPLSGRPARGDWLSAFLLGIFFSLSFCPINVVLFFGLLIPLAYRSGDALGIPAVFAIVSSLPVLAASLVLATSARHLGRTLTALQDANLLLQRATGAVFLGIGLYYIPRFLGM